MYRYQKAAKAVIKKSVFYIGETIEQKIRRITTNKEPISDGAPLIYTERRDGVKPEHDIRTDRFEIANEKMDYIARAMVARRENKPAKVVEIKPNDQPTGDAGGESIQTTK